jgi:enoyl-CoA hydratase/carnithine racemase
MPADENLLPAAGLRWGVQDCVATITLNRPERRNAMTPTMWRGLAEIGAGILADASVRVVVIRGEGPSFCAGIDLRMFSPEGVAGEDRGPGVDDPGFGEHIRAYQEGYFWLRDDRIVSIAAVQGHAIGAGFQLALACDLRVLADNARLCMKEPALGLVPDLTGTKPLVELVGRSRAIELCLTARTVDAHEARELRLAEYVVAPGDLEAKVAGLARGLTSTDVAAARATKGLLAAAASNSLEQQAAAERAAQAQMLRRAAGGRPPR